MAFLFIVYSRMSFGWIKVNKKKDKPWWKRKEYKIPEEHFKVLKRPGKAAINRFQKNFAYHNSSQFRHWILGASVLLAFITLGCVSAKIEKSSLNPWICGKNSILPKLFCLASNEKIAHSLIMTRGIKLRKFFGSIKRKKIAKKCSYSDNNSKFQEDSFEKLDAPDDDEEWETIEGILYQNYR